MGEERRDRKEERGKRRRGERKREGSGEERGERRRGERKREGKERREERVGRGGA